MECIKKTNDLVFKLEYADKEIKVVEEGILFEFDGDKIIFHLGTGRKECLFSVVEALTEVIAGLGLGEEFKNYVLKSEFLESIAGLD